MIHELESHNARYKIMKLILLSICSGILQDFGLYQKIVRKLLKIKKM